MEETESMWWIWILVAAIGGFVLGGVTFILWAGLSSGLSAERIVKAFTDSIRFRME